jgi:protein SCO1/2
MMGRASLRTAVCWLLMTFSVAAQVSPAVGDGKFALTATDGSAVTEQSYRGKIRIIYFGYTFCPDACPTALNEIADALAALGPEATRVQALFITIDPRRDTAAVLAEYVKAFDTRIVALTGTPAQTSAAARAYGVMYVRQENQTDGDRYLYDHSSYIYVMDAEGKFAGAVPSGADGTQIAQLVRKTVHD